MKASILHSLALTVAMSGAVVGGCSKSSSSPSPAAPASPSPSTGAETALSSQFTSTCGACHGTDGASVPPSGTLPVLKGNTSYGETAWQNAVRNGISGTSMISYSTTTYSVANLEADYTFLTGATWSLR